MAIDMSKEAMKLALEALKHGGCPPDCKDGMTDSGGVHPWGEAALIPCPNCRTIDFIREALAEDSSGTEQPAQQRHISYACPQCHWSLEEQPAQQQEPYGQVMVVRRPGCVDQHWFYRWPEPPYLDNAAECHTVYTSPPASKPLTPEWYAQWIRNNYQDYWNIATLCDEMTKAAHGIKENT